MYRTLLSPVRTLLKERGVFIRFVDIGSRNGVLELGDLADFVDAFGFEPNPEEFRKLTNGDSDASFFGIRSPRYHSLSYSPFAISDRVGRQSLYVTIGPGAVGMLAPNVGRLREIRWKGKEYPHNFAEDVFAVREVIEVETDTLQRFIETGSFQYIDYLKIDVEGSEYEVLKGAGDDLLRHVGVIKVEVCFIPMRKGQKIFSEVDLLLRQYGFDLLRYEITPEQIGFKERTASWSFGPSIGFPERFGQPIQADALYVNRTIDDPQRAFVQAVILLEKNYLDEALYILRRRCNIAVTHPFSFAIQNFSGTFQNRLLVVFFSVIRNLRFGTFLQRIRFWNAKRALRKKGVLLQ